MAHLVRRWCVAVAAVGFVTIAACGGSSSNEAKSGADAGAETGATSTLTSCHDAPPAGFTPPTLPTYSGTCPTLTQAPAENMIMSSGSMRQFKLVTPTDIMPGEKLPVVFLWYWLGGSAQGFIDKADIVHATQQQRFIAVVPEAKVNGTSSAYQFKWPDTSLDTQASMDEEFTFFDDMLACVAKQYPQVNPSCISSAGVSAGALFTDQLGPARANVIASILSLSGGVGGSVIKPWKKPSRDMPAIVLWGGPMDQCFSGAPILNFQQISQNLEDALHAEGSFFVECVHNCAHNQPPFDVPPGMTMYAAFWDFVNDHPYWLPAGASPYKTGLPSTFPSWCSVKGKGTAVPRTGACSPPAC